MKLKFKKSKKFIEQLKQGDEKAYVFLVDTYHRKLFAYALGLTNDHAMAQDLIQNIFLKTWEYRMKLDEKHSIQSFLYKSIYNEFINQYWKGQSKKTIETEYVNALNEIIEESDDTDLKKMEKIVTSEIENLPSKCKTVFLLSKKEGLSNIEISKYLNISKKSVEGHITKAYKIIRKKIGIDSKLILFIITGIKKFKPKFNRLIKNC